MSNRVRNGFTSNLALRERPFGSVVLMRGLSTSRLVILQCFPIIVVCLPSNSKRVHSVEHENCSR